jgi:hypothetical protein
MIGNKEIDRETLSYSTVGFFTWFYIDSSHLCWNPDLGARQGVCSRSIFIKSLVCNINLDQFWFPGRAVFHIAFPPVRAVFARGAYGSPDGN